MTTGSYEYFRVGGGDFRVMRVMKRDSALSGISGWSDYDDDDDKSRLLSDATIHLC